MKKWNAIVKITWNNFGVEGKNKKEAIETLKEMFYNEHGIELADNEIIEIEEDYNSVWEIYGDNEQ